MRYLIKFSYNGQNYCGWQVQKDKTTIQSCMQQVMSKLVGQDITLHASGRTDSGVSAIMQTAHFDCDKNLSEKDISAFNHFLPQDIQINKLVQVSDDFHARYNVVKKTYVYNVYFDKHKNAVYEKDSLQIKIKIDFDKINEFLDTILGTNDYSVFCAANTSIIDKVRTIFDCKFTQNGQCGQFEITANGFLYNMVRIIVGTAIDYASGKNIDIKSLISSKDRRLAGKTISSKGLILKQVYYDFQF